MAKHQWVHGGKCCEQNTWERGDGPWEYARCGAPATHYVDESSATHYLCSKHAAQWERDVDTSVPGKIEKGAA